MARVISLLVLFLLSQAVGAVLILLGPLLAPGLAGNGLSWAASSLLAANVFLGVALWRLHWVAASDMECGRVSGRTYAAVLFLMVPAMFLVNLLAEWLSLADVNGEWLRQLMHDPCGVLVVSLCAPLTEEMLFRGGVQGYLQRSGCRPVWAVVVAAALFAVVHANPAQMPAAFLLGVLLGAVYGITGSLWPSVVAHVFNNASGVMLELFFPDVFSLSSVLGDGCGMGLSVVVAFVALVVGGYVFWRSRKS